MIQNPIAKSELLDLIYPIGSVYINVQNVSPEDFLGGVWEQIQGKFLLATQNGRYTAGETGGEETHTLTIDEIPSHNHMVPGSTDETQYPAGHGLTYSDHTNVWMGTMETGGTKPHNNMPPYLVVYMWQRTE